jgi:pimeloyl-ACP methyl ester carboxylesterase
MAASRGWIGEGEVLVKRRLASFVLTVPLVVQAGELIPFKSALALSQPIDGIFSVEGRNAYIHCTGEGTPTVVLEAGMSQGSLSWAWVQADVAKTSRVCSYDRAGYGRSDPLDAPMDAVNVTRQLNALIAAADVKPPFVLVGHSLGGAYMRMFAAEHRKDTVGLVLVDATNPSVLTAAAEVGMQTIFDQPSALTKGAAVLLASTGGMRIAIELGYFSLWRERWKDLPTTEAAEMKAFLSRPERWRTFFKEQAALPDTLRQVGSLPKLGNLRLTVIASDKWGPANADEKTAAKYVEWNQTQQRKWLALSTNSRFLIIPGADHLSLLSNPEHGGEVANAVAALIVGLRRDRYLPPVPK